MRWIGHGTQEPCAAFTARRKIIGPGPSRDALMHPVHAGVLVSPRQRGCNGPENRPTKGLGQKCNAPLRTPAGGCDSLNSYPPGSFHEFMGISQRLT